MRDYSDPQYKAARLATLKRDKKCCQMIIGKKKCGKRWRLNVHHIIPWSQAVALRYEVSNLITLCKTCHDSISRVELAYVELFMEIVKKNTI